MVGSLTLKTMKQPVKIFSQSWAIFLNFSDSSGQYSGGGEGWIGAVTSKHTWASYNLFLNGCHHRGRKRPMHSSSSRQIYFRIWSAALLPDTSHPPPPRICRQCVAGRGWGRGGCWVVLKTIFCRSFTLFLSDHFQNLQNFLPTPRQNEKFWRGGGLKQIL